MTNYSHLLNSYVKIDNEYRDIKEEKYDWDNWCHGRGSRNFKITYA